ncbi:NUDIX domain-containing protein [Stella humosa]|uniref:NUDIX domain-containing protein n=1 Tax=Stella humosa TaxID=94 RepID=A0A3N1LHS8_9PROT|nr:NUDIX hydrolase [Stella humosa]ROP91087.1 NUDIX domain-containing protein [Stella humosa]BBK34563.1 ADP-ribose pyrophosphatase [Stella humosa]
MSDTPADPAESNPWTIRQAEVRYENRWISVTHNDVLTPAGTPGVYGTVHYKNLAIGVIPVDADGATWLVGQFRFPLGAYSWEIPEGGGPHGIPPLESAMRELVEETGLVARAWAPILEMDLSNAVSDERAFAYLAWDLTQGQAMPEPTEQLQLRRLPLREVFAMVRAGGIRDALSVAALQALELRWRDGSLPAGLRAVLGPA